MRINRKGEALRQPAGRRSSLTRALAAAFALCALCALAGCGQAQVASDSPRLADVRLLSLIHICWVGHHHRGCLAAAVCGRGRFHPSRRERAACIRCGLGWVNGRLRRQCA